jgi:hypothetical protein
VRILVIDGKAIDRSWSIDTLSKAEMAALDEIAREKQRISQALARVDAQREKLASELDELEATERVLARYSKGPRARQTASAATSATVTNAAAAPARRRGRQSITAAKPSGGKRTAPTLGDQVLALANGKTQQQIVAACKGARPNHVGAVIARHKRAGRIEERDGKLYATHSSRTVRGIAI